MKNINHECACSTFNHDFSTILNVSIIPIQNKQKQFNKFNQYWTKKCELGMKLLPRVYFFFWGLL